ncbi:MAG: AAA family ATPase, partial [Phycisphaerae bacterium]|nr:AAA family ATPase [Phycisphaerae bacterium]
MIAMYIARVHIENFRCFRNTSVDFVQGVNVIIGENNSGKTALLQALGLIFSGSSRPRMQVFDFNQAISDLTQPPAITVTVTLRSEGEGADGIEDQALVASWLVRLESPWEAQLTYRFALPDEDVPS